MNDQQVIKKAHELLVDGGIILYPTDTIWGIGCDARNENAVKKIFQLKRRAEGKSLVILLDSENKLDSYMKEVPPIAFELIEYAESPLTIIYPNAKNIAPSAISEDGSSAIRIVKAGFIHDLLKRFRYPIVSTSANISNEASPKSFEDISEEILNGVDYICKVQDKGNGMPSTIMKLEVNGQFSFIRR